MIDTHRHDILDQNLEFSFDVRDCFLDLDNFCQGSLPDRFRIIRSGFQSLNAGIQAVQPQIDGVESSFKLRLDTSKTRIHRIEAREDTLFKRALIWKISRAFLAYQAAL